MQREYHKWHSKSLNREMEMLVFGHGGARAVVIPTQSGRFYDWEDRGMIQALQKHIDNGWIQLFCVDSVDPESWDNGNVAPRDRAARHLQYQDYMINEVLPFTEQKNDNPFVMAVGASFGAYHSVSLALRYPTAFDRVVAMSGIYDIHPWTDGYDDELVHQGNPSKYIKMLDDPKQLEALRNIDLIVTIGNEDPAFQENTEFSNSLWEKGVWHAFRVWDGYAHDWPVWHEMVLHYIGGPDSKGHD
jgi:esterase/lipase superfamily enzyme